MKEFALYEKSVLSVIELLSGLAKGTLEHLISDEELTYNIRWLEWRVKNWVPSPVDWAEDKEFDAAVKVLALKTLVLVRSAQRKNRAPFNFPLDIA